MIHFVIVSRRNNNKSPSIRTQLFNENPLSETARNALQCDALSQKAANRHVQLPVVQKKQNYEIVTDVDMIFEKEREKREAIKKQREENIALARPCTPERQGNWQPAHRKSDRNEATASSSSKLRDKQVSPNQRYYHEPRSDACNQTARYHKDYNRSYDARSVWSPMRNRTGMEDDGACLQSQACRRQYTVSQQGGCGSHLVYRKPAHSSRAYPQHHQHNVRHKTFSSHRSHPTAPRCYTVNYVMTSEPTPPWAKTELAHWSCEKRDCNNRRFSLPKKNTRSKSKVSSFHDCDADQYSAYCKYGM